MTMKCVLRVPCYACALGDAADARPVARVGASRSRPAPARCIVLETAKGTIEFETYPEEAPKTVARIVELVKKNFYNGQRFHRAEPKFVVQIGDPQTRNMQMQRLVGAAGFGKPIGVVGDHEEAPARPRRGRDGATPGPIRARPTASSTSCCGTAPELDAKYTVFGRVINGMDVADRIRKGGRAQEGFSEGVDRQDLHDPFQVRVALDHLLGVFARQHPVRAGASGSRRWPPTSPRNDCWRRDTPSSPRAASLP